MLFILYENSSSLGKKTLQPVTFAQSFDRSYMYFSFAPYSWHLKLDRMKFPYRYISRFITFFQLIGFQWYFGIPDIICLPAFVNELYKF